MSKLKDILSMSRHERNGALAVLALMAIVLAMIWAGKSCLHTQPQTDDKALELWAAQADSARYEAQQRDSAEKALRKTARQRAKHGKDNGNSHSKATKKPARKPSTPPPPTGLPPTVPNF